MSNLRNQNYSSLYTFDTNLFNEENTKYAIQEVNLPGLSFSHIQTPVSSVIGNLQGDTLNYNPLNLMLIVDSNLIVWKELITTMQKMRNPDTSGGKDIEEYGFLEILDHKNNNILKLQFRGLKIETVSDLSYNSNNEADNLFLSVDLVYDYFEIV